MLKLLQSLCGKWAGGGMKTGELSMFTQHMNSPCLPSIIFAYSQVMGVEEQEKYSLKLLSNNFLNEVSTFGIFKPIYIFFFAHTESRF